MEGNRALADIRSARDLTKDNLRRILASHYGDQTITVTESDIDNLSSKNDYFNSDIIKTSVKITSAESGDETIHLIYKCPIRNKMMRTMHKITRPFMRETIWYKRGLPYLARYHPVIKTLAPDCLYATANVENEYHRGKLHWLSMVCFPLRKREDGVLVLEDLTQCRGGNSYSLADKNIVFSYDHVRLVLEGLGHLHGAWWQALHGSVKPKEGTADLTARDVKDLYDVKYPKFVIKDIVSGSLMSVAQLMENSGRDPAAIERLRRFAQSSADGGAVGRVMALTKDSSKFKTIVHGDFWSNNMMFHYNEEGKPDKVRFFDYQMMVMGHPTQDICYFLCVNTDKSFRDKYLDLCLRSYYNVLQNYLTGQEYSFDTFRKEFQKHRAGGMFVGIMTMPNVLSPNQISLAKFSDWGEMKRKRHAEITGPDKEDDHPMIREIRRRLLDIVDELQELKVI